MNMNDEPIKSGIVALVGPPNVGKSTLLNSLLGQKISIVSPKPQTTRNRILGIVNARDYQIIMLDTPGLHEASSPLNLEMVRTALDTLPDADVILFLIDAGTPLPHKANLEKSPLKYLNGHQKPAILLINKIDTVDKMKLLPIIEIYQKLFPFQAIIPISGLRSDGLDTLIDQLLKLLPEGPRMYPEDIPTDATERFIAAEIIREKIFLFTGQEIPYSSAVVVDSFKEQNDKPLVIIHATIYVEKSTQKGIVIGKQGAKLNQIGSAARKEIETLLGQRVVLKLWVKIKKNWSKDPRFLQEIGF